jgi:uncharacterized membrane protein
VTGLLIWVPLVITLFILTLLVDFMDQTLLLLPENFRPETLLGFRIPGLGAVLAAAVLLLTGLLVTNIVGRKLVDFWESLLNRIPLVRSVYSAAKSFAEMVLTNNTQSFKQVLLIEYPRKGIYSMGFQTAGTGSLGEIQQRTGEEVICVFVPTTPNPTSGFIMFVPKQDVMFLDMAVEDAIKMVVSLGVVVPQSHGLVGSVADPLPVPAVAKD